MKSESLAGEKSPPQEASEMDSVDLNSLNEDTLVNHSQDDVDQADDRSSPAREELSDIEEDLEEPAAEDLNGTNLESTGISDKPTIYIPSAIKIINADPEEDDTIKEFPTMPHTPIDSTRRRRHNQRRSNSMALSISSISSNGQQTISSSVFIKKAFQLISKHKAAVKIPSIMSSVGKALGT